MDHILHSLLSETSGSLHVSRHTSHPHLASSASNLGLEDEGVDGPELREPLQGTDLEHPSPSEEAERLLPRGSPPDDTAEGVLRRPWPSFVSNDGSLQDYELVEREDRQGASPPQSESLPALDPIAETQRLEIFPATTQGYITKVRWHSFQFLMVQLADELAEMNNALTEVLSRLPDENYGVVNWLEGWQPHS
eukprot:jgi/Botrbrau1/8725/Bobra.0090s0001.1